jgi:hypothetical protein
MTEIKLKDWEGFRATVRSASHPRRESALRKKLSCQWVALSKLCLFFPFRTYSDVGIVVLSGFSEALKRAAAQ